MILLWSSGKNFREHKIQVATFQNEEMEGWRFSWILELSWLACEQDMNPNHLKI